LICSPEQWGLSLGFEWAGFDVKTAVELDPVHYATHEFNFQECKTICASVVDISGSEILKQAKLDAQVTLSVAVHHAKGFH